ncbi:ATP-grasp domain-containing protein [Marinimicrobium sp. ARAG 43.8]|uniref:ATP-grasp domain-containing protein n=1 Tax=Marinimicrobium sp. ARAG 43.8 TaxID=3418719 RepID=UPI003CEC6086
MNLVSFDPFRTLGFPNTRVIKPEHWMRHQAELTAADWVLFPEYWQINTLVYGLGCRIFPSQSSYLIGHNKVEMSRVFEAVAPRHVPTTHILANTPENAELLWERMSPPFVAKRPKSSMGEGVWLIEDREQWCQYLTRTETLYVQEWLPIDRDIRVVVVGRRVLAAYWRLQSSYSFHNNIARGGQVDEAPVPEAALALALRVAHRLQVDHAGFDIAMLGTHPVLIEFNRLFGHQGIAGGAAHLREAVLGYLSEALSPGDDPDHPIAA